MELCGYDLTKCKAELIRTVPCYDFNCSLDCKVSSWEDYSEHGPICSVSCGLGIKSQRRRVIESNKGTGLACPSDLTRETSCFEMTCPLATECILSEWSNSGPLNASCGIVSQLQSRRIIFKGWNSTCSSELTRTHTHLGISCEHRFDNCSLSEWQPKSDCSLLWQ